MRILSKFHDYYDKTQGLGQDQSLVFHREQRTYADDAPDMPHEALRRAIVALFPVGITLREQAVLPGALLVAGRLYPFFQMGCRPIWRTPSSAPHFSPNRHGYSVQDLSALLETAGMDPALLGKQSHRALFSKGERTTWEQFLGLAGSTRFLDQAVVAQLPLLRVETPRDAALTVNPRLADAEFFRVMDPWQTQQELAMFLGGLARPEVSTTPVSDKDRVAQRGFDSRSFRKDPEPTRAQRRAAKTARA